MKAIERAAASMSKVLKTFTSICSEANNILSFWISVCLTIQSSEPLMLVRPKRLKPMAFPIAPCVPKA